MRKALKILLLLLILLAIAAAGLLFACIQKNPLVPNYTAADAQNALDSRNFVRATLNKILYAKEPVSISVSETELNSLASLATHALPRLHARINIEPSALLAAATLRIPHTPLGQYLNTSIFVLPSEHGLRIESVQLGHIQLNGRIGLGVLRMALNMLLGDSQGDLFLSSIKKVSFSTIAATVLVDPPPNMLARFANIKHRFKYFRDKTNLYGDPQLARIYYQILMRTAEHYGDEEPASLNRYLVPLFTLAQDRSKAGNNPITENRAAILALTVFLGDSRFERLVGSVRDPAMRSFRPPDNVQLANRRDLRLHFIYSAALKILTEQGISVALGEYKELTDSGKGGSGFSFADLAADRSGIYFAERATETESGAAQLQSRIANGIIEADFFPNIRDLPEGLNQQEFTARYGNVESANYQAMVQIIDARIHTLPLYQP